MITNNNLKTEIEYYGIAKTIEILNDKLEESKSSYSTFNSSNDMKEIVECIIMLDEQLNKNENRTKAFLKVTDTNE